MPRYRQFEWNDIVRQEVESGFTRGEITVLLRCKDILRKYQPELYPGRSHQAPMASKAIWNNIRSADRIIDSPPSGFGPSLTASFRDSSWCKNRNV